MGVEIINSFHEI